MFRFLAAIILLTTLVGCGRKPVAIDVTFPAGGGYDIIARLIASASNGRFFVKNLNCGGDACLAGAREDIIKNGSIGLLNVEDSGGLKQLSIVAIATPMLVVRNDNEIRNLDDVAAVKTEILYAVPEIGTFTDLAMKEFVNRHSLQATPVPYRNGMNCILAVKRGDVPFTVIVLRKQAEQAGLRVVGEFPEKTSQVVGLYYDRLDKEDADALMAILASDKVRDGIVATGWKNPK